MDERALAIEGLYRRRYLAFRNGLAPVVGSREAPRDVVQEAFARALRERSSFRGDGSLESWIWRIAIRVALASRRNGREMALEEALATAGLPEPERDPAMAAAIASLPPRRRLVVFLRYFADLSYSDIAEICGIAEGTVAASLAQAHGALLETITEGVDA